MADIKVNELPTATPALTDKLFGIGASEEYQAEISGVANVVLKNYSNSSLETTSKNVVGAINELNDTTNRLEETTNEILTGANDVISEATKNWLDENVTPTGSAVVVDSSLKVDGAAADAKATGDAFSSGLITQASLSNNVASFKNEGGNSVFTLDFGDIVPPVDDTLSNEGVPADAKAVGDAVNDLKSDFNNVLGYNRKTIPNAFINETGTIATTSVWDCYCYNLSAGTTIEHLEVSATSEYLIYAFYGSEPILGSQSYNSIRTLSPTLYVNNLIVPYGTSWLVVRCAKTDRPVIKLSNISELIDKETKYAEITGRRFEIESTNSDIIFAKKSVADNTGTLYIEGQNICPKFSSATNNGITFTVDENGIVTANGTNNSESDASIVVDIKFPIGGRFYTVSGTKNGSTSTYCLVLGRYLRGIWNQEYIETGDGYTFKASERYTYKLRVIVRAGETVNNVQFKPQIVEGMEIKEYQPYSMQSVGITANGSYFNIPLTNGKSYVYTGKETVLTIGVSCKKTGSFTMKELEYDNDKNEKMFKLNKYRADEELLTDYSNGWEWGVANAYIDGKETGRGATTSTTNVNGASRWYADFTTKSCVWLKLYVDNLENLYRVQLVFRVNRDTDTNSITCDLLDQIDHNGLNYVRVNLGDGTVDGTVSSYRFREMRLKTIAVSTDSATQVNFGHIYTYDYTPICSLWFDDGDRSQYENAFAIMKNAGLTGDIALITGRSEDGNHLTISEIHDLVNNGWEVTNHTHNHKNLTTLSQDEIDYEVSTGRDFLKINGSPIGAEYAVIPFDSRTQRVVTAINKYAKIARNNDDHMNTMPVIDPYTLGSFEVQQEVTLAQVKAKIDKAISDKTWLILLFHIIDDNDQQYHWLTENFSEVIDYLVSKSDQIKVVNVSNALLKANGWF